MMGEVCTNLLPASSFHEKICSITMSLRGFYTVSLLGIRFVHEEPNRT